MEGRVSMQSDSVAELVPLGHEVVEGRAGVGAGLADDDGVKSGARLVDGPDRVFSSANLIVQVKEPVPEEYDGF